jgi:hypothetical protein
LGPIPNPQSPKPVVNFLYEIYINLVLYFGKI